MEKLIDKLKWFTERGYILSAGKGKYNFSRKFYDDLKTEELVAQMSDDLDIQVVSNPSLLPEVQKYPATVQGMTYTDLFIRFIQEAQVPPKAEDTRGNLYPVNKYNDKAAIRLYKLIASEGVDYKMLCRSTNLYYKGNKRFKKTIANYIIDGDWRTDYDTLSSSVSRGEEALKEHIKQETKDESGYSGYELG
jgi:hypothetical protein